MTFFKKIIKGCFILIAILVFSVLVLKLLIQHGENKSVKEGNIIIEKIEEFCSVNNRLPTDLNEVVDLDDFTEDFYYDFSKDGAYTLSFPTAGVGESITYYSKLEKWNN